MDDKNKEFLSTISIRAKLLNEMAEDKKTQLEASIENLKRLEGYNVGSKDSATKLETYLNQQKLELVQLVSQQKLSQEIGQFIEKLLNNISMVFSVMLVIVVVGVAVDRLIFGRAEAWVRERWGYAAG